MVTIIKRLDVGGPLTPAQEDGNLQNIVDAIDALQAMQGVSLNVDGTLTDQGIHSAVPAGTVIATVHPTLGSTAGADGWLYLDGAPVSRTGNFAALFALIGTSYGVGNGSTTFNPPDYRGRYLTGASPGSLSGGRNTPRVLGSEAGTPLGEEEHTLLASEIPAHSHPIDSRNYNAGGVQSALHVISETSKWSGGLNNTGTEDNQGGGDPFSQLPPSAVIRWLIKL